MLTLSICKICEISSGVEVLAYVKQYTFNIVNGQFNFLELNNQGLWTVIDKNILQNIYIFG